jgi:serine/threonine-protein kinase
VNVARWRQVDQILQDALALQPHERKAFVDHACSNDAPLRAELQRLIHSYERAGNFLERPVEVSFERLQPGTSVGPYVVEELIGVGGMGEVYRATDTRLGRQVALKMMRDELARTPAFRDRVEREARTIASLNHPHVCALYDIGEDHATTYLVMEYVSGELLSNVLKAGRLSPASALRYAREIADALAAVHKRGILHRDLKPGNVMITGGGVKVLDFGLAKFETAGNNTNSKSPTEGMSHPGIILGTAAYMSPEQARGQEADKRCDIWAFGCVLYEMLTGKRAFNGSGTTEILAAVLKNEPDWSTLPPGLDPSIRRLLRGCLEKDADRRIADISTASFLMDEQPSPVDRSVTSSSWLRFAALLAIFVAGVAAAGAVFWRAEQPPQLRSSRLNILATGSAALTVNQRTRDIAISPDGSRVVYVGNGGTQLFVRPLDQLEIIPLTPPSLPSNPFFSPDGQWVGFMESGDLKKVAITGGPVTSITQRLSAIRFPAGATWGTDGTIVFANKGFGLYRVPKEGGQAVHITHPNSQAGEADHLWPEFLPGRKAVLFTITSTNGQLDDAQVAVLDLETGKYKTLLRTGSHAHYAPTGHLIYGASGTLRAIRFDLNRLETIGAPLPVLSKVVTTAEGSANFDIAHDGTLAYVSGGVQNNARFLMWVDREGREEPLKIPPRTFVYPRLSPDGLQIALDIRDQDYDIWIWDLPRESLQRITRDPAAETYPIWTPDGGKLIYTLNATGRTTNLYSQVPNGSGLPERLTESSNGHFPSSVSPTTSGLCFRKTPQVGYNVATC